jgi:FixJ family two-component response regulator
MDSVQLHIAVVDDEKTVRRALERLLRSAGMAADLFPSGKEFVAAMPLLRVDCLVLDLHMPGLNGFEVLAHLAKSGSLWPVVVITGHDSPESRTYIQQFEIAAYLLKPVDDCVLLGAISAAVGNKE